MAKSPRPPRLETEQVGDVTVVRLARGSILSEQAVRDIGDRLAELIGSPGCRKVVLNLARVEGMTTLMVSRFIALHRQAEAAGGRLALCSPGPFLSEVFSLLGLPRVVPVYGSEDEALQSFG